jgi:hypothetical protein
VFVSVADYNSYENQSSLYVLDASTGNTKWSKNYGEIYYVGPPAYADGKVYLQTCNHYSDSWLRAYDANNGDEVYRAQYGSQYDSYYAPTISDGDAYVGGGQYGGMYSFDGASGARNWFKITTQYEKWTPAIGSNYAYVYEGEYAPALTVVDRNTGQIAYSIPDPYFRWRGWSMDQAVALGSHSDAFAINGDRLICFDLANRSIKWQLARAFGDTGQVTVAEYDAPSIIYLGAGSKVETIRGTERTILDKTIRESYFKLNPDDMLVSFSDGIVLAGVGEGLRLGWQEEGILDYVSELAPALSGEPSQLTDLVTEQALTYWAKRPGDDGTVLCAKYRKARLATVLTGPPADRALVPKMLKEFLNSKGAKIICGGTTSHLVADHLQQELKMDERLLDSGLPLTGKLSGIDLVTEGILTLSRAAEYMKRGRPSEKVDAASLLIDHLLTADGIKFMVGTARNPAHQNTGLPDSLFLRRTVVETLATQLQSKGKEVELVYY